LADTVEKGPFRFGSEKFQAVYPGHENTDYAGEVAAIGARPGKTGSAKFYLQELFETILITNAKDRNGMTNKVRGNN